MFVITSVYNCVAFSSFFTLVSRSGVNSFILVLKYNAQEKIDPFFVCGAETERRGDG